LRNKNQQQNPICVRPLFGLYERRYTDISIINNNSIRIYNMMRQNIQIVVFYLCSDIFEKVFAPDGFRDNIFIFLLRKRRNDQTIASPIFRICMLIKFYAICFGGFTREIIPAATIHSTPQIMNANEKLPISPSFPPRIGPKIPPTPYARNTHP